MLAEQRRSVILETLSEQGAVSVAELYRKLGVSRETIRRDISRLDQESRLRKTHGGAMSLGREPAFAQRKSINVEAKRSIGRVAAAIRERLFRSWLRPLRTNGIFVSSPTICRRRQNCRAAMTTVS